MRAALSSAAEQYPKRTILSLLRNQGAAIVCAASVSFAVLLLVGGPTRFLAFGCVAAAIFVLLRHPEFALALYAVAGDIKGDERVSALLPFDLTLALAVILASGILLNLIRGKRIIPMPPAYFLLIALVGTMAISLGYTPVFSAGVEKLARFLTVTAIGIIAPFFVLNDPSAMKRFFFCLGGVAYAICLYSLAGLGGSDRLVSPSENTIGLGRVACIVASMLWAGAVVGLALNKRALKKRILVYAALTVPVVATLGSGSRGAAASLVLVIIASLYFYKRLVRDIAALLALGLAALPFIRLPESSLAHLATLADLRVTRILDFRADLLHYGWDLLQEHPLIGVGLGGFRYSSPNPGMYKWPHNIFLEIACELGIPSALIVCLMFALAVRESCSQIAHADSAHATISRIAGALLLVGIVNAVNTGDINSDRLIWMFVSLVFVIRGYRVLGCKTAPAGVDVLAAPA